MKGASASVHVTAEEHFLDSTPPQFGRIGNASRLKIDEQARQYRPQLHLFPKRERTSAGADHPPGGIEHVFDLYLGSGGFPANDGRTSV